MHLRQIKTADNSAVKNIIQSTLREFHDDLPGTAYYDPQLANLAEYYNGQPQKAAFWVVVEQKQILGCGGFGPFSDQVAELQKLYFLPAARGYGFGKEIMLRSLELAPQLGYQQLYIETFANLDQAIGLYQHLGFKPLTAPLNGSIHSACDRWFLKSWQH